MGKAKKFELLCEISDTLKQNCQVKKKSENLIFKVFLFLNCLKRLHE